MYATSTLLIVCGIPATVIIAFIFTGAGVGLSRTEAFMFGGCMIVVEVVIALILEFAARHFSRHGDKTSIRHDTDA
jgi:MFS-type transporter involved in bile tolerance (Atg22 family)